MSRRYFLNGSIFDYVPSLGYVDYDDIVDKSSFVLDSETTRQRILSGSVGSSSKLLYDSDSVSVSDVSVEDCNGPVSVVDSVGVSDVSVEDCNGLVGSSYNLVVVKLLVLEQKY